MVARWIIVSLVLLIVSAPVAADGGIVRVSRRSGPWRLTVFSDPTPLRAGPADLSVLVQDADTDDAILDATISVLLTPVDPPGPSMLVEATPEAAENRLLRSALVDLPGAGRWRLEVTAMRGGIESRVSCDLEVGPPLPPIVDLWIWFLLPVLVIMLIILNQWLQRRGSRPSRIPAP